MIVPIICISSTNKRLDRAGLLLYDFGARWYNPATPAWTTPDPLAEKYYDFSPYAYCAGDPVNLVDPEGMEIRIKDQGLSGKKEEILYTEGMSYNGDNPFISRASSILNDINSFGGHEMIHLLSGSPNIYYYDSSSYSEDRGAYISSGEGGTIFSGHIMNSSNTYSEALELLAHESFHALQDNEGQGGASIFNEVEAYAYAYIIQLNWIANSDFSAIQGSSLANQGLNSSAGERYSTAFEELTTTFSSTSMLNAVKYFKTGALKNGTGIYNNYPLVRDNTKIHLLNKYYPSL